jgi:hypothetical protein
MHLDSLNGAGSPSRREGGEDKRRHWRGRKENVPGGGRTASRDQGTTRKRRLCVRGCQLGEAGAGSGRVCTHTQTK